MAIKETNIFISYRRMNGGIAYAYILNDYLSSLGINCFLDIKSMHSYNKDFEKNIISNIDNSDYVIVLLQDGYLTERPGEDYFLKEIRYAISQGKELIMLPIGGDFRWEQQENIPKDIAHLKMLNLCTPMEMDNLTESMSTLLSMLKKDNMDHHYLMLHEVSQSASKETKAPVLQKSHDISSISIDDRWKNATRISLMAVGCSGIVLRFDQEIKKLADSGTQFRFLAVDPEGSSANDFTKHKINGNSNGARDNFLRENYTTMALALGRIQTAHNSIEYRLTSDHLTFTMHWVERANDAESYIFIEFLPIRVAGIKQDTHNATIIKRHDPAYDFFVNQFNEVWAHSRLAVESDAHADCEFCFPPAEDDKYILATTKYWRIYLANNQNYPGRCIIPLLRHCESLSEVTSQEMDEFHQITKAMEKLWTEELGAVNFNWNCLMNTAYLKVPAEPHVHFHFIPRYNTPFKTSDGFFIDEFFGQHYTISQDYQLPLQDRMDIHSRIKEKLEHLLQPLKNK